MANRSWLNVFAAILQNEQAMETDASFESVYTKLNTIQMPGGMSRRGSIGWEDSATIPLSPAVLQSYPLPDLTPQSHRKGEPDLQALCGPQSSRQVSGDVGYDEAMNTLSTEDSPQVFPALRVSHPMLTSAPWQAPRRLTQPLPREMRASSESVMSELSIALPPSRTEDTQDEVSGQQRECSVSPGANTSRSSPAKQTSKGDVDDEAEERRRVGVLTVGQAFALLGIELEGGVKIPSGVEGASDEGTVDVRVDLSVSNTLRLRVRWQPPSECGVAVR
jgi:hypothetical protein